MVIIELNGFSFNSKTYICYTSESNFEKNTQKSTGTKQDKQTNINQQKRSCNTLTIRR